MTDGPRIACSETALERPLLDAWSLASRCGIDAIEVYGAPDDLRRRLPNLRSARGRGVVISTVCVGPPFLGRVGADEIDEEARALKLAISIAADLETSGIVMPIAALPSFGAPPGGLRPYILEALAELADHAGSAGTSVLIEPLNRYEDGEVNRLEQAVQLSEEVGSTALSVCADLFHMNIEERDAAEAIHATGERLRHVHVADSNRRQPGAGHLDFPTLLGALRTVGYDGWLALECVLDEPVEDALRTAVQVLQDAWHEHAAAPAPPGSPWWQDDAPSSSAVALGTMFAATAHR